MCRFFSGFFFRHELTLKYEYFLRLDSDSHFLCDIEQDPFLTLINQKKMYGFLLADIEAKYTIENLWETNKNWALKNNINNSINPAISYLSNDNGVTLTEFCIFYNNFEIASFSIFRNRLYLDYFEYLDRNAGFYYERWVNLSFSLI